MIQNDFRIFSIVPYMKYHFIYYFNNRIRGGATSSSILARSIKLFNSSILLTKSSYCEVVISLSTRGVVIGECVRSGVGFVSIHVWTMDFLVFGKIHPGVISLFTLSRELYFPPSYVILFRKSVVGPIRATDLYV